MPGHDLRHSPPVGLTWDDYLQHFIVEHGGWTALADELVHRASPTLETPLDLQTIERGLRRLSKREHKPAGKYGRWMLRFFGVPPTTRDWARSLAQYHSRFADLPASIRIEQLRQWDRPPVSESSISAWIHVGLASVFHRTRDLEACTRHLQQAQPSAERAGDAAVLEVSLLRARIATDAGDRSASIALFDAVAPLLDSTDLSREDALSYRARLVGQRAYQLTKPAPGESPNFSYARELFEDLEQDPCAAFACFRRNTGLAYCTWRLGDATEGARLARRAAEFAGDGGLVRFRIMALNMLSLMVSPTEGRDISKRAERLARQLEDDDLLERVQRRARKLGND